MPTTITITNPGANGDPFPDPITGVYANCPGLATISVAITNEGTGIQQVIMTVGMPGPGGSGTWSVAKPSGLASGLYTIVATLNGAFDKKINIQN